MQPIIVIGMHRSGSSLLVKVLEELGVFMGNDLEENNESIFFNNMNEWLLKQAGASWYSPESFNYISDDFKSIMVDILKNRLKGIHQKKYLGKNASSIGEISSAWGWKDPRNTFTIDVWKELFPDAKIIHIYRNPVDVVSSLVKREMNEVPLIENKTRTGIKKKVYGLKLPSKRLMHHKFKCTNKDGAYSLWKEYTNKALSISLTDKMCVKHIAYEDLIENPKLIIKQLIEFCNLDINTKADSGILKMIDKSRKYAFLNNSEYLSFYESIKNDDLLSKLNYQDILAK